MEICHFTLQIQAILHISYTLKCLNAFTMYFNFERADLHLNAVYNFPRISVHERPDDGSQLQPKHAAVNKLIKKLVCAIDLMYIVVNILN